jgi:hypothetical protein
VRAHNAHVPADVLSEEELESRWEAAPGVVLVMAAQLVLALVSKAQGWTMSGSSWWAWLIPLAPEVVLLLLLTWERPRRRLAQAGLRRTAALSVLGLISLANALLLVALITSLVHGHTSSGVQLLMEGSAVWGTNVVVFALWFWAWDRGGPVRRRRPDPPPPDFQFPQMENPQLAEPGWHPHFVDYVYVSFTNSIAFSPTDAMPLTRPAKLLMLGGSAVSALTILLVAARAVNILR